MVRARSLPALLAVVAIGCGSDEKKPAPAPAPAPSPSPAPSPEPAPALVKKSKPAASPTPSPKKLAPSPSPSPSPTGEDEVAAAQVKVEPSTPEQAELQEKIRRALAKNAPSSAPSSASGSATAPASDATTPERAVVRLLRAQKFAEADAELARVRALGRLPGDYRPALGIAIKAIARVRSIGPQLDEWCARRPKSYFAHTTHALHGFFRTNITLSTAELSEAEVNAAADRLARARIELEDACALEADAFAPTWLITLSALVRAGKKPKDYLERAIQIDARYYFAYDGALDVLKPRHGESSDALFEAARGWSRTHPDEPALKLLLVEAHAHIARHSDDPGAYLNDAKVKSEVDDAFDTALAAYPNAFQTLVGRSELQRLAGDEAASLETLRKGAAAGGVPCQLALATRLSEKDARAHVEEIVKLLEAAARKGDPIAQALYAGLLEAGTGVGVDFAQAARWYRESAEMDEPRGLYGYSRLLRNGLGVKQNKDEGVRYLALAADAGLAIAQYELGDVAYRGDGVPQDKKRARSLFESAAAQGYTPAKNALAKLSFD